MFDFLFKKNEDDKVESLNIVLKKLSDFYGDDIEEERKQYLAKSVRENGYLAMPYFEALENLTPAEMFFALKQKWNNQGVFKDGKFVVASDKISPLVRCGEKNSDWIKREGHDIKLINLAGLGNRDKEVGKFTDWLYQLLILPAGNTENKIHNTTIYLIPFHPREFGCAYMPKSSEVSEKLFDEKIFEKTGMDVKSQVKTFIRLAQLAGHPVIYDILPQTGRFSKAVLANPYIARWFDISLLQKELDSKLDEVVKIMSDVFDAEDLQVVKDIYKQGGNSGNISEYYENILTTFENKMDDFKKTFSEKMLEKSSQIKIQKKVKNIVAEVEHFSPDKKIHENDITQQQEIVQKLIKSGLWTACGGAWCSAGVPIYDKMSDCGGFPVFKHYDYKGEDVSHLANLDCQTPYYFAFLESGNFNMPVIKYFIDYLLELQSEYNFDGFRFDHVDHVADVLSEYKGNPISYRIPRLVLGKINSELKRRIPYFATLAEYMLGDNLLKEYHCDMKFDLLWGDDIILQDEKTPQRIIDDNVNLYSYNVNLKTKNYLSVLKTYNNQDGEFKCINHYPAQYGVDGALFKWLKLKFLSGGKFAQRPCMYADGDESFTNGGLERTIDNEVSMKRGRNSDFYKKFNAIDVFVKKNSVITDGEAHIMTEDDDGFVAWLVSREPFKNSLLVIANSGMPNKSENHAVFNKTVYLPLEYKIVGEYIFDDGKLVLTQDEEYGHDLCFEKLDAFEFRIFEILKG